MKVQRHPVTKFSLAPSRQTLSALSGWLPVGLGLALLGALLLPLNLLTRQPLHHDEALYATWAVDIASGTNPWLVQVSIDKPPLFLYLLAGAMRLLGVTETVARLPSLLATVTSVGFTFWLGRKLYGDRVGLLAAWLVALSPFTILFAPTAFTDPMMVALLLASAVAAAGARPGWAGLWLGLAIATKQQGIFFVPLILALLMKNFSPRPPFPSLCFFLGIVAILMPLFIWDSARNQSPGFWQLSLVNYGGFSTSTTGFTQRWSGFVQLLRFGTASPVLNTLFVTGLPLLLVFGLWRRKSSSTKMVQYDWILTLFSLAFLGGHAWFSFQIWDRYLLGLIPFLALLLARVLLLPWTILKTFWLSHRPELLPWGKWLFGVALVMLLAVTLARPVQDATNARYPLGSNSHALGGIEQIVAYLQGQVGANQTLYHRWLGTHWRFFLRDYPYDLQFWESPQELAARAQPGHLIAFPGWQSDIEARLALAEVGLELHELVRAYAPAGYPSIILYRLTPLVR